MDKPAYHLRRRLAAALGLFVAIIVVGATCAVLAATSHSRAMAKMHRWNEIAERTGALASLAREARFRQSPSERGAIMTTILEQTSALRDDLRGSDADSVDGIARLARDRDGQSADDLVVATDMLNADFRMRAMHVGHSADTEALLLVSGSVIAVLLAPLLAFVVARRLWRDFDLPLGSLRRVAEQITLGDRAARVGTLPAAELVVVGQTFDAMLDELKRAEQKLIAAERLAAIGRVAAGVAHEINNPIAVIRGYVKMMREEAAAGGEREDLRIIDEEAANCQRIAEDLLAYARAPSISRARCEVATIFDEAVSRLRGSGEIGCEVIVETEPATIDVDPGRIRQVVTNLVRNACEATSRAGTKASVEIAGRCTGADGYQISVQDRGPGVPAADRDRLFEPFFTTRSDGTGLGLAVCYGLVTAHGGAIDVIDRPGGGTIIRVDLPHVRRGDAETATP